MEAPQLECFPQPNNFIMENSRLTTYWEVCWIRTSHQGVNTSTNRERLI